MNIESHARQNKNKRGDEMRWEKNDERERKILKFIYLLYILFGGDKIHLLEG